MKDIKEVRQAIQSIKDTYCLYDRCNQKGEIKTLYQFIADTENLITKYNNLKYRYECLKLQKEQIAGDRSEMKKVIKNSQKENKELKERNKK